MGRGRLFLILALVLVGAVVLFVVFGRGLLGGGTGGGEPTATPTPEIKMVDVVVVIQPIASGTEITSDVVTIAPIEETQFKEEMLTELDKAVGRRAKIAIDPGSVLTGEMLTSSTSASTLGGSDWALEIPRGKVAISIPISRLSSVAYALRAGDHVNVIVTMMFVDLDAAFQSELPNNSAAVLAPGPAFVIGLGQSSSSTSSELAGETEKGAGTTVDTAVSAEVGDLGEFGRTSTSQVVSGGAASPVGRSEGDEELGLYVVPSESQRPRMVSQTLIENVMVLRMGDFPLEEEGKTAEATPDPNVTPTPQTGGVVVEEGVEGATPVVVLEEAPPDVVTLIVSPQDAVVLNYLLYSGAELTLALRNPTDDTVGLTEAVTMQFLLERHNIPIPVKLPFGMTPRVDDLIAPTLPNDTRVQPTPAP